MFEFRWAQCRRVQPSLWDYASERLSEDAMEQVEQHLQRCTACQREMDSLKRAQTLLAACRAQEEPAPRSDWSDLQQRIVADGLAHITTSDTSRRVRSHARRTRPAFAGRAPWAMQLATSAAGGFAAVFVLALGYSTMHRHSAPDNRAVDQTVASSSAPSTAPSVAVAVPVQPTPAQVNSAADSENVANIVDAAIKRMQQESIAKTATAAASAPIRDAPRNVASAARRSGSPVNVAIKHNKEMEGRLTRVAERTPAEHVFTHRTPAKKILASTGGALKFRPYTIKPNERLTDGTQTQVASRYALEHVQPVGNDSDDSNIYVVGSVRPVSREDEGVY